MQVFAFLLAILAFVLFVVDYARTRSFVSAGLAVLTIAWVAQGVWQSGTLVVIH